MNRRISYLLAVVLTVVFAIACSGGTGDAITLADIDASVQTAVAALPTPMPTPTPRPSPTATPVPPSAQAILEAAADTGVRPGKTSYELLESWLGEKPDGRLLEVWGEYVVGIAGRLDESGRRALHDEIIGGAKRVAEAAGGILGFGNKISREEQAVIDELERAFDAS